MINFEFAHLQVVRSVTQRGLAIHWPRLKRSDTLPRLSEFHPEEGMRDSRSLAGVRIITLGGGTMRRGSWIAQPYNADWVGKYLDATLPEVDERAIGRGLGEFIAVSLQLDLATAGS